MVTKKRFERNTSLLKKEGLEVFIKKNTISFSGEGTLSISDLKGFIRQHNKQVKEYESFILYCSDEDLAKKGYERYYNSDRTKAFLRYLL